MGYSRVQFATRNMAWLTKQNNNRYYLKWREDGRVRTKALGKITKKEAERKKLLLEESIEYPSPSGPTFIVQCEKYIDWHKWEYPASTKRIEQIITQHLIPVFKYQLIGNIKPKRVEQFKIDRLKKASTGTVEKEIRTLKAILNKAVEWGTIDKNPVSFVKTPRNLNDSPPPYYSLEDLTSLYKASNEIHEQIWRLASNTGMRRSELQNLRRENIRDNGIYVVSGQGARTKSGKWRLIPFSKGSIQSINYLKKNGDGQMLIPKLHSNALSTAFKRDAKRALLPGSLHWLRYSYASHLVMNNVPLRVIQQV